MPVISAPSCSMKEYRILALQDTEAATGGVHRKKGVL